MKSCPSFHAATPKEPAIATLTSDWPAVAPSLLGSLKRTLNGTMSGRWPGTALAAPAKRLKIASTGIPSSRRTRCERAPDRRSPRAIARAARARPRTSSRARCSPSRAKSHSSCFTAGKSRSRMGGASFAAPGAGATMQGSHPPRARAIAANSTYGARERDGMIGSSRRNWGCAPGTVQRPRRGRERRRDGNGMLPRLEFYAGAGSRSTGISRRPRAGPAPVRIRPWLPRARWPAHGRGRAASGSRYR